MTGESARDPVTDHLLTPQNTALVVIDYQPSQVQTVTSMDRELLVDNIISVARLARTFDLPVVLSTINVANGQKPTIPELKAVLPDSAEIDRTQINAWENVDFRRAVETGGRKKLIITALWTEVCLAFPALDAIREGFEVYPVVDAVGGDVSGGTPCRTQANSPGRCAAHQLGVPGMRASAGLGPRRDGRGRRRHRAHHSAARQRLNDGR
jgi:isochorismate hydrolase